MKTAIVVIVLYIAIALASLVGWCTNIYKFVKSDFEAPYKQEVIRGVGVFIAPVGAIAGYVDIND